MGVVQGPDGRIYEIPDDELSRYAVPEARLEEVLNGVSFQTPSDQDGSVDHSIPKTGTPPTAWVNFVMEFGATAIGT